MVGFQSADDLGANPLPSALLRYLDELDLKSVSFEAGVNAVMREVHTVIQLYPPHLAIAAEHLQVPRVIS
ncbi:hypothetical protein AU197_14435 [Mycobacterium sp. IS-1590]|nr:hypothetical protein AU197_14435 [Mycobacterium sp. IS-1590]